MNHTKHVFRKEDGALIARFTVYMRKVVENAKRDYIRRQYKFRLEVPMDEMPEPPGDSWMRPALNAEFDFEEERLAQAFSDLPLLRRKILTLAFIHEMPVREIADELNCSAAYVAKQKHLALKKLRGILLEGGGNNGAEEL